jgi:hypothetical protein
MGKAKGGPIEKTKGKNLLSDIHRFFCFPEK